MEGPSPLPLLAEKRKINLNGGVESLFNFTMYLRINHTVMYTDSAVKFTVTPLLIRRITTRFEKTTKLLFPTMYNYPKKKKKIVFSLVFLLVECVYMEYLRHILG